MLVTGSSMLAWRSTCIRGNRLVCGNPDQIEGRVNGRKIVILTPFVRKS